MKGLYLKGDSAFSTFLNNARHTTRTRGIYIAKEILGENIPYIKERRIDEYVIIFDDHFILMFLNALSTGCTDRMSNLEKDLLFKYIRYEDCLNKEIDSGLTTEENLVCKFLDKWMSDERDCKSHPRQNKCSSDDLSYTICNSGRII